ncbi:MAG: response regulator [Candidatus Thiodiazotropha sp. (ex Monitilora ramsayi)]|nr:response regulator [Candidatus Thiodiazotropha sp. (ex Monitilora ramsayi)]
MSNAKVLLVDDDRLILSVLVASLKDVGYEVETASSGEAAIGLCQHVTPDLVVLDMRMSGMDGVEVARWIRTHTDIPFIFLSAYGEEELVTKAVTEGAMGYLIKPVDPPQLHAMIHAALERNREYRLLREKEAQLTQALSGDRAISTAIGILISRECLSEQEAFERLRRCARDSHRKLGEVAKELVETAEKLNRICLS